ncbi:VanZ family protein [Paenibacillus agricola]|uniref:VanZ family protein n=1 Tax=Paenibacillus agricola TaxID=2716264 RepID=A0ABX0J127_9BACL|nr:VanZ family protein [Paenibacillus agricola]NHN29388.1 VanZ family protein [Paenibacillus agricola]
MDKRKGFLILLLLWIVLILYLSFQTYQQQSIQPWLRTFYTQEQLAAKLPDWTIHYLGGEVAAKTRPFTFVEFLVRKGAHVCIYALLALLSYLGFATFISKALWRIGAVMAVVLLVAGFDEWNQSFTTTRTGVVQDIGIDLLGAALVVLLVILNQRWRTWKQKRSANLTTKSLTNLTTKLK